MLKKHYKIENNFKLLINNLKIAQVNKISDKTKINYTKKKKNLKINKLIYKNNKAIFKKLSKLKRLI